LPKLIDLPVMTRPAIVFTTPKYSGKATAINGASETRHRVSFGRSRGPLLDGVVEALRHSSCRHSSRHNLSATPETRPLPHP
jgi:hypothetical protein